MALTGTKFNNTVQTLARGGATTVGLLLNADTLKLALCTAAAAPIAADTAFTSGTGTGTATEVSNANGYLSGGSSCGAGITANVTGTETLRTTVNPPAWTASTAGFSLRYLVLWDTPKTTPTTGNMLGFWDYTSTVTLSGANADTFTVTGPITAYATLV